MPSALRSIQSQPQPAGAALYLGPGHVTAVHGPDVEVTLGEGTTARARLALAFPYAPAPGDELLVVGKDGEHYVIGVLQGSGRTALSFQGDVDVRAEGGALRLSGDAGVAIRAPELEIEVGKMRVMAGAVVQRFASLYQRVSAMLSVHAGQTHTVVDDSAITAAKSAAILTEETMTINGSEIHLGQ
jgi:Protein of unknown function (DUF3540)